MYDDVTDAEREQVFEQGWRDGGFHFVFETFDDIIFDQRSNDAAAEFIREKIRATVNDPETAELLCPKDYPTWPSGRRRATATTRRTTATTSRSSTWCRTIGEITPEGVRTVSGEEHQDAKFHVGHTMLLGTALGLLALYFLWRRTGDPADNLRSAALIAATYWVAQAARPWSPARPWWTPPSPTGSPPSPACRSTRWSWT